MNLIHSNGQLNYKEVCGRLKNALKPFKQITYKTNINQLRNTVYVDMVCGQSYERIRISTHEPREDKFEGLSIIIKTQLVGIVQPIRKFANFMVSNKHIDHKTNSIIKTMYNGQTLEYLTNEQLDRLLNAIIKVLEKRPKAPQYESCRIDIPPVAPTLIHKETKDTTKAGDK